MEGLKVAQYEELRKDDVLHWLRPLWDGGGWVMYEDGRLRNPNLTISVDSPWVHNRHMTGNRCGYWAAILSDLVGRRFSNLVPGAEAWVPSPCQDCYKVVVRPRTLTQLFILDGIQKSSGLASKCGIEVRPWVPPDILYGGYFYNRSLGEGRNCYKIVRRLVDATIGYDIPVILKRGCTEMEMQRGPSDKWAIMPGQLEAERLVGQVVDVELKEEQPAVCRRHTVRMWLEFAWANGDETCHNYMDEEPRPPLRFGKKEARDQEGPPFRPVTYHEGI